MPERGRIEDEVPPDPVVRALEDMSARLAALERAVLGGAAGASKIDPARFVAAIEDAVETLRRTKSAFKSKDLGRLRRDLESLLAESGHAPVPRPGPHEERAGASAGPSPDREH